MEFRTLGPLEVAAEGGPLRLGGPKQRRVLAELLLQANTAVSREQLLAAVWGEAPPKTAVTTLQVYVHGLRQVLGSDRIATQGSAYRLTVKPGELDLEQFEQLLRQARTALDEDRPAEAAVDLEAALALWRGPALADLADAGETPPATRDLEARRLDALELRNEAQLALGRHELVLAQVQRLIGEHPFRERLRAQQMLALYRAGRQTEALDAYRTARSTWIDELGVEPTPALQELERAILRHDPSLAAPLRRRPRKRQMPVPPTPLIGRRLETAAVTALLRSEARLVTLVGPGGTGKTRVALAVAEELAPELSDGAAFVDLSAIKEPALLAPTIAHAVAPNELGEATLDDLCEYLRESAVLLVLDNFEQLLPAAPQVSQILAAARKLRIVATSRAPLRLAAEHQYPVQPLPLPAAGETASDKLARNEAVALFSARARALDPAFALDAATAATVARICTRLDGLPLAIELAAARTSLLAPEELLGQLERRPELAGTGPRDLPARQATLTATIRWSYDLLDEHERDGFVRLAVFSGGWTAEAAERVCDVGLDVLATLADHSLIRRHITTGAARFTMLETLRAYALRLLDLAEGEHIRRRHAEWLADLADTMDAQRLSGGDVAAWLDRIEPEHDNVRTALAWSLRGAPDLAVRLVISLRHFWDVRGHLREGRRWLEEVLASAGGAPDDMRAKLLEAAGKMAFHSGNFEEAERDYGDALQLARRLGDAEAIGRGLSDLGTVAAATGRLDRALELLDESAATFRQLGEQRRLALVLANTGHVAAERGDWATAISRTEEALAIQREHGDPTGEAVSLLNLGSFMFACGDVPAARQRLDECLSLALELGYREVTAYGLAVLVRIALLDNDPERAATLAGVTDALLAASGVALLASANAELAEAKEQALAQLGEAAYAAAHAAGVATPLEEALPRESVSC